MKLRERKNNAGRPAQALFDMVEEVGLRKTEVEKIKCFLGSLLAENLGQRSIHGGIWQAVWFLLSLEYKASLCYNQVSCMYGLWSATTNHSILFLHFNNNTCYSLGSTPVVPVESNTAGTLSAYML